MRGGCEAKEAEMATIMPEGEKLRQAVKWIAAEKREDESRPLEKLIQQAAMRFNLSPKEEVALTRFYLQEHQP